MLTHAALLTICLALPAQGEGEVWKPRPLPDGPEAFTSAQFLVNSKAFWRDFPLDAYKRISGDEPEAEAELAFLLEYFEVHHADGEPSPSKRRSLAKKAQALFDAGCDDILILNRIGFAVDDPSRRDENPALAVLDRIFERLDGNPYGPMEVFWAGRLGMQANARVRKTEDNVGRYWDALADGIVGICTEGAISDGRERYVDHLCTYELDPDNNRLPLDMRTELVGRLEEMDNPDPWLRAFVIGAYLVDHAWELRGTEFAHAVEDHQWAGFDDALTDAQEWLIEAHELQPDRPEAATEMIQVVMGYGTDDYRDERYWFDQAVAAQFDTAPAYSKYLWAMRPRWGGSHRIIANFGLECAQTERYDTDVPLQMGEAILLIARDLDNDLSILREKPATYRVLREAMQGRIDFLKNAYDADRKRNDLKDEALSLAHELLAVAWWAHDWDTVADMASERRGTNATIEKWFANEKDVYNDALLMRLRRDEITRADRALVEGRADEAVRIYAEVREALPKDGLVKRAMDDREVNASLMQALDAGGWVDVALPRTPESPGWRKVAGLWMMPNWKPDYLISETHPEGARTVCKAPIGRGFQASVEIDFTKAGASDFAMGGVLFDHPGPRDQAYYAVTAYPNCNEVTIWSDGERVMTAPAPIGDYCTLDVVVKPDTVSVLVNNKPVITDCRAERHPRCGAYFGLGARGRWGEGRADYTSLRLRKLPED